MGRKRQKRLALNPKHQELSEAILVEDIDKVRALIDSGVNPSELWSFFPCPMEAAKQVNNVEIAKLLLSVGTPIYVNESEEMVDAQELDFIWLYAKWHKSSHDVVMLMLEHAESVNNPNSSYNPLVHMTSIEDKDIGPESDAFFAMIVEMGADPDLPEIDDEGHETGETMLHWAVLGDNKYVTPIIELAKNIDACPDGQPVYTPLESAVTHASVRAAKALIQKGANVNVFERNYSSDCADEMSFSLLDLAKKKLKRTKKKPNKAALVEKYEKIVEMLETAGAKTFEQMLADGDIPEIPPKEEWID